MSMLTRANNLDVVALFRRPGVCQRDCTSYYGFLEEEAGRLSGVLEEFFAAEVCKKFPDPDCESSALARHTNARKVEQSIAMDGGMSPLSKFRYDKTCSSRSLPLPRRVLQPHG